MTRSTLISLLLSGLLLATASGCGPGPSPAAPTRDAAATLQPAPRLALWLAKKEELLAEQYASHSLVMSGWFEPAEADALRARTPGVRLLAGFTHTWVLDDTAWLDTLTLVANGGDPQGSLGVTSDMYLRLDTDGDGQPDQPCSPPGWEQIKAMDPRSSDWQALILAFYTNLAAQPQHDGAIVDMVDAYPFCDGASSAAVPLPLDPGTWVAAQDELLGRIREVVPREKWLLANAGHDFPPGSPFPQHLNGYLLENFLGAWGATLGEGLASAERALSTTLAPHIVVFAVDTDDTGQVDPTRFRTGFAASLLLDNTYFAFDYGSRDHGGVRGWWSPAYEQVALGEALAGYSFDGGIYRREYEYGRVVVAAGRPADVEFDLPHVDVLTGTRATRFTLPAGDAGVYQPAPGP